MPAVLRTLGGKQFWADELFFHQWRIQRNVLSGHYRLLDAYNLRHASGTFDHCRARLEQIKLGRGLPPMQGKAVIVLHGLGRSRSSMAKLCNYLEEEGGYTVCNVSYASTQGDMESHAQSLGRLIASLDGISEINFVAHSMGNIVIRRYLAARAATGRCSEDRGGKPGVPIQRCVMLAPPNHGSRAATALGGNLLFQVFTGKAGRQLGPDWQALCGTLATPAGEFGIIAGGKGDERGFNPLLRGDNDGTISVATTRLAGASDFVIVPVLHTFIMSDQTVIEYTLRFLQQGCFVSPATRKPLA